MVPLTCQLALAVGYFLLLNHAHLHNVRTENYEQARKPRSYASLKLRLTDLLTDEGKV